MQMMKDRMEGVPACTFPVVEAPYPVISNDWVNGEYKLLVVEAEAAGLAARAGQFFHLACPPEGENDNFLRRPMSIHRIDRERGQLHFLYKVQGNGTRALATLQPGDTLDALGPVGQGFSLPAATQHVLMVGRGVGLATLAPLAQMAIAQGAKVTAVLSARSQALVMGRQVLEEAGASVHVVTDDNSDSDVVSLEGFIRRLHAASPVDFMATCGSNRLLMLLQKLSEEFGAAGQVALEQRMGCALGMCIACVRAFRKEPGAEALTYRRVCWEGPVFDMRETVAW
ncbi:dihydroorotate dehydrogenase electron transfer subunit [Novosphingobium rosa]|uniref:dihydroorotate dehydrogenase electron transfer subunit n=1 Tax=Novosphingobium rosa TaxID=76978 RepID=UPI000A06F985|nr:dihydroorotate dehydrogenase electron transfer subunit [Novosphingobium rosa]